MKVKAAPGLPNPLLGVNWYKPARTIAMMRMMPATRRNHVVFVFDIYPPSVCRTRFTCFYCNVFCGRISRQFLLVNSLKHELLWLPQPNYAVYPQNVGFY